MSIVRQSDAGSNVILWLRLDCRYDAPAHKLQFRMRSKLKDGTSNFRAATTLCNRRRGKGTPAQSPLPEYTEARHRAIIAVHVSACKRLFHSVEDPEYLEELRLVSRNPDIKVPSQETVQDGVKRLYVGLAPLLTAYFEVCLSDSIHTLHS